MLRILIILLFLFPAVIFSQNAEIRINDIIEKAKKMGDSSQHRAIELSKEAYRLAKENNYKVGIIESRLIAARNSYDLGVYQDVITYAVEALELAEEMNLPKHQAEAGQLAGMGYGELGFYDKGKTELNQALKISHKITENDERLFRRGFILSAIAVNFDRQDLDIDSVIHYHKKARAQFQQISTDKSYRKSVLSMSNSNIGLSLAHKGEYDLAEKTLLKSLELSKGGSQHIRGYTIVEIGNVYNKKKAFYKAVSYFNRAHKISEKLQNPYLQKNIYIGLHDAYSGLNKIDSSQFFLKEYARLSDSLSIQEKSAMSVPIEQILDEEQTYYNDRKDSLIVLFSVLVFTILLGSVYLIFKSIRDRKRYRSIIERLEVKQKSISNQARNEKSTASNTISSSKEQKILKDLDDIMVKKEFLNSEMSLPYLAHQLNTNTKYLSEVIRNNKGKNFNAYINGLRIEFIVEKLYTDKMFRRYKISSLAEESGFSSREVFSSIFKKETGLSPFKFINSIKKEKNKD